MSQQISQVFTQKSSNFASPKIWAIFQIGVLILPIIPSIGCILIFITIILTWIKYYKIAQQSFCNKILAVLSIWLIITSCFATYPQEAFLGLANYLPFFFAFSSLYLLFNHPSQLRQIAWLIVIPSALVAILGLGQLFLNWHIPYILGWKLVASKPEDRMSSIFINSNFLAIYLQIVLILGFGLLLEFLQYLRKKNLIFNTIFHPQFPFLLTPIIKKVTSSKNNSNSLFLGVSIAEILIFIFLTITLLLDSTGLILAKSRNGWTISFVAITCFFIYQRWYKALSALGMMGITIIWSSIGTDPLKTDLRKIIPRFIWKRLSDEDGRSRPIEILRITHWEFAIDLIKERPLIGWGLRNFTPLYKEKWHLWSGHPHNFYLMFTAETGIIGITLLGIFIGIIIYQNLLLLKQLTSKHQDYLIIFTYLIAFASCMLFNCFDVSLFDLRVNVLTWILLFALGGLATVKEKTLI